MFKTYSSERQVASSKMAIGCLANVNIQVTGWNAPESKARRHHQSFVTHKIPKWMIDTKERIRRSSHRARHFHGWPTALGMRHIGWMGLRTSTASQNDSLSTALFADSADVPEEKPTSRNMFLQIKSEMRDRGAPLDLIQAPQRAR